MSRFLNPPLRLALNQPRGYFYQTRRAHPPSVAERGHVVFNETHIHTHIVTGNTLAYMQIQYALK